MGILVFLPPLLLSIVLVSIHSTKAKLAQKEGSSCDLFKGNWVLDNSYPLYDSRQCPFIETQFDCQRNGRPDTRYTKYRWNPTACILPRFNGVDFLRKLKGKRLIFVGDSLSLNQWQSLTCLLHTSVPSAHYTLQTTNGLSTFSFPEYSVSLLFYRNAFLVDLKIEARGRVLALDSITNSRTWGGMDIMIFDSWHWWLHTGRKQPWEWIAYGNTIVKDMNRLTAYAKALNTWAKWIDTHVDPSRTQVFFQGVSPDHYSTKGSCSEQMQPLKGTGIGTSPLPPESILENVLRSMETPVYLLDVTRLSQERIDGHPSVYGHGGHRDMDCTHWCLSGIPDIWNELLYAMIK